MNGLVIREMRKIETEKVLAEIVKEVYPELIVKDLKNWLTGEKPFVQRFVAEFEKKIVGACSLGAYDVRKKEVILDLYVIVVLPQWRRKGVGEKLLEISLEKTRKHWLKQGFKTRAPLIETSEAMIFYEKVLTSFKKVRFEGVWGDGKEVVFYFVPFQ